MPIVFPVIQTLGFDPIWFGVIIVMTVELGLITPPVGMNVYVINSIVPETSLVTIFRGVAPFILTDLVRLALLVAFPGSCCSCRPRWIEERAGRTVPVEPLAPGQPWRH